MIDPVKECDYYREVKCPHIDGQLCDMETCEILKEYKTFKENIRKIEESCINENGIFSPTPNALAQLLAITNDFFKRDKK